MAPVVPSSSASSTTAPAPMSPTTTCSGAQSSCGDTPRAKVQAGKPWSAGAAHAKAETDWKRAMADITSVSQAASAHIHEALGSWSLIAQDMKANCQGYKNLADKAESVMALLLGGKVDGKSWKETLADNGANKFDFIPEAQLILTMPELTLMLAEIASTRTRDELIKKVADMATARKTFSKALAAITKAAKDLSKAIADEKKLQAKRSTLAAKAEAKRKKHAAFEALATATEPTASAASAGAIFGFQWPPAQQAPSITAAGLAPECTAALAAAGINPMTPYVVRAADLIGEAMEQAEVKKEPADRQSRLDA